MNREPHMKRYAHLVRALGVACAALMLGGCVERTVRIETTPPGALVMLNDEEVGVSPTKSSFVWYGDYDIVLRKPGYKTFKTHYRIDAPWYEWPPFDLIAETLIPTTIRDVHVLPPFELEPVTEEAASDLVERAVDMRERTLYEGQAGQQPEEPAETGKSQN